MRILENIPAIDAVRQVQPDAIQTYAICDSISEFADLTEGRGQHGGGWAGGMTGLESTRCLREGDLSAVAKADDMLSKLEAHHFETKAFRVLSDVVGGVPDVPSFLAGHPMQMRRRQRINSEQAPLSMYVDLTSSGGISAAQVLGRGIAILALTRLLSNIRPVELFAVVGLGRRGYACEIVTKIDTAPMDLARAAHMLTHPSVSRSLGYGYCEKVHNSGPCWNFDDINLQRKTSREAFITHLSPAHEVLYLPPVFLTDDTIPEPVKWINKMLKEYGGISQDEAA